MVRCPGRRAGSHVGRGSASGGALAADVFIGWLAALALCKPCYRSGNAIGNPVNHTRSASAFRVDHGEREALRSGRRIGPGQWRRNILTDAVRIAWCVVGVLFLQRGAVLERRGRQHERFGRACDLNRNPRCQNHPTNRKRLPRPRLVNMTFPPLGLLVPSNRDLQRSVSEKALLLQLQ